MYNSTPKTVKCKFNKLHIGSVCANKKLINEIKNVNNEEILHMHRSISLTCQFFPT